MRVTRFAIAPQPVLPLRFRRPLDDRASAPEPVKIGEPARPPLSSRARTPARAAHKPAPTRRRVQAQAPARRRTQTAVETTRAPRLDTEPFALIEMRVASELAMPGFFGDVTLKCDPASHDMRRLRLGTMPLLRQHDHDAPIGRVRALSHVREADGWAITGEAEIGDFARAREVYAEMRAGARIGVSPGFVIVDSDMDDDLNLTVTRAEIFECSVVTGARNYGARVTHMEASMDTMNGVKEGPEIVSTSDLTGLSLSAGRAAMRSGKGTNRQRVRLGEFFKVFDAKRAEGLSRDEAALAAKEAARLA